MNQGQEVCRGPGEEGILSRMFTKPETWEYLDPETEETGEYSSYYYNYQMTDEMGRVNFDISFNEDYIGEHHRFFDESVFSSGSITYDELEDYRLYIRVWHTPIFEIGDMALSNSDDLLCSQGNNAFDFSRISEFDNYSLENMVFYSGSYAEGLINLYPEDVMLGVPDLLVYQYGSELNDNF